MMMMITAGGTGGHIMPALSVGNELRDKFNWDICWLGGDGMEVALSSKANIPFYGINIRALRGKGLIRKLLYPFILIRAFIQSLVILRRIKPNLVFTTGGYIGVPAALAAYILGKPIFLQEQNTAFGWASGLISLLATRIYMGLGSKDSASKDSASKVLVCGNPSPIERALSYMNPTAKSPEEYQQHIRERYKNREGPIRIFVIGGSQGAAIFNRVVPEALAGLEDSFSVWHQAGAGKETETTLLYTKHNIQGAKVEEFIDTVVEPYEWADLVIARAGAMTVTELSLVGVAAILVPFPYATGNHQMHNARALGDAVTVIDNAQFNAKELRILLEVWSDPSQRLNIRNSMAESAANLNKFSKPNATETIVNDLRALSELHKSSKTSKSSNAN